MRTSKKIKYAFIALVAIGLYIWSGQTKEDRAEENGIAVESPIVREAENSPGQPLPEIEAPQDETEIGPEPERADGPDILSDAPISDEPAVPKETVILDVPFFSQAPLGEWSDPRQQEGCEEASALMAVLWARGEAGLSREAAKAEILAISAYEEKNYGNYHDTSAADTLKIIINGYLKYDRAELKEDANLEDLKQELAKGNVVILPMDGKKLKNPNFTADGPERHNIVIRGWDEEKKEFITNDPGTRKGEGYRYSENIIEAAWRDYLSGTHVPIKDLQKNMIVIRPL